MKPETSLYIKLGLSTLCYALSLRLVAGGIYWIVDAWLKWKKQRT